MNIALSQGFLDCLARLPAPVSKRARELISRFRSTPDLNGLNFEAIQGVRDRNFFSTRVDIHYRAILWASPEHGNYVFLWIDQHDDAYAWARRTRVAVNPELGALQVYSVEETISQNGSAPAAIDQTQKGMFSTLRDRELMRLGVPEELISLVRSIATEDELISSESKLPALAYQGLFLFTAGYSYDEAVNALERNVSGSFSPDDDSLLKSPESRSSFYLIEDDQELEEMLDAPLEKWRVFLHPTQRRLVEREWNGPVKVLGGPGTGKTVVALHRARWLAQNIPEEPGKKILFTTFTVNLAEDIKTFLTQICGPEELSRIEVKNIDMVARSILRQHRYDQTVMFENSEEIRELWSEALSEIPDDSLPNDFYREEWEEVIQPNNIRDIESYKAASRIGRKVRLARSQLVRIWPVFQRYLDLLHERGWIESQDAFFVAEKLSKGQFPYQSIVIDETQDMGITALALLRSLVPEGSNDLFLVGDAHQTLYSRKTVLSRARINVRGRSRKLFLNYRTTREIGEWAVRYLQGIDASDLDDGKDNLVGYHSLLSGMVPLDYRNLVPEKKIAEVRAYLETVPETERSSTCIALPSSNAVDDWQSYLESWGIPSIKLEKQNLQGLASNTVCIATIHRIKGLEFDRVVVKMPSDNSLRGKVLAFVAATRAKRELIVL